MSGSISIVDLQSAASEMGPPIQISSEIGNVIEVTEMTDDLGLNLLANQNNIRKDSSAGPSFGSEPLRLSVPDSAAKPIEFETMEPISLNIGGGSSDAPAISMLPEVTIQKESSPYGNFQSSSSGPSVNLTPAPPRNFEMERQEKTELLNKLQRLEAKGYPVSKRFTMDNSLDEIKGEYSRLVDAKNLERSIGFQRNMLTMAVRGIEYLNGKFDPFDVDLDGWTEKVSTDIEEFDDIFEELYDKYKNRASMPPEVRLFTALVGSGFTCAITNSFFRQKMPTMDDVMRNNPMLAKQVAQAAAAQAGGNAFGNLMGMAMGVPPAAASPGPVDPPGPTGAFFGNSGRSAPNPSAQAQAASAAPRREMRGPSGVDDILKTFEEVRRTEMESIGRAPPPVFTAPPPATPTNQPAMVAVSELQSVISDEMSQAETIRTAGGSRRRGGRRGAAPVGNTVSLDV